MPDPITGIVAGGTLVTSVLGNKAAAKASKEASEAQLKASREGIAEQRRQFDFVQKVLQPYSAAGVKAIEQQGVIAGLEGRQAQAEYTRGLAESEAFTAMAEQGENAILQNASATGGLRGGNVQGALAQFRPALLNQMIEREYSRLGGLAGIGQASAAGEAVSAVRTGENVSGLITQGGQAVAGNALAQGQAAANQWGDVNKTIGIIAGGF
jgi:hypothetical protein